MAERDDTELIRARLAVELARFLESREPEDPEGRGTWTRDLRSTLEWLLTTLVVPEADWSEGDWIDGVVATKVERSADKVLVTGAAYTVVAGDSDGGTRMSAFEADLRLAPATSFIRFAGPDNSIPYRLGNHTFVQPPATWRYEFEFELTPPKSLPLLLLDVDGVLSPVGSSTPPGYTVVDSGDFRVTIGQRHAEWLRTLRERFEIVWATSWGEGANRVYGPLLDLPRLRAVDLPRPTSQPSWKREFVSAFVGDQPFAWVDDELNDDDQAWASQRKAPSLLVRTRASVGLTESEVSCLNTFADSLEST